jgi:hypothetical protein
VANQQPSEPEAEKPKRTARDWAGIAAVITAIAALLGALGTLIAIFLGPDDKATLPDATPTSPPAPQATTDPPSTSPSLPAPTPPPNTSEPGPSTSENAVCTPMPGGLEFTGGSLTNSGGPNYVPDGCSEIGLELTAVTQVIHAQACLETVDGTPTGQCGAWVPLEDGGAWNVLYADVPPGTRWVLNMTAAGPDSVEFLFTG